jgi:hypothetical protein
MHRLQVQILGWLHNNIRFLSVVGSVNGWASYQVENGLTAVAYTTACDLQPQSLVQSLLLAGIILYGDRDP